MKKIRNSSNKGNVIRYCALVSGTLISLTSGNLQAQTQSNDTANAKGHGKNRQDRVLEEIIVTATKRDMSLREIPQSITAFGGSDLESMGVQSAEEIARLVPGVNITQPGDSAARITVRGIAAQSGTNATTGVLFGDISFTDAYLQRVTLDPNPFDLKSVEVLKGPQGTLFGAGALNGAIRYVPETPKLDEWELKYFGQYTKIDEGGQDPIYGLALNIPISNSLAARFVATDRKSPGWIDNTQTNTEDANWIDQNSYRGSLLWKPVESLTAVLTYANQETQSIETPVADNMAGELKSSNKPRLSPSDSEYDFSELQVSFDFSWATLVSDTAVINKQADNFFDASSRLPPIPNTPTMSQVDTGDSKTWSQELRLVSRDDINSDWRWVTGVVGWKQEIYYQLDVLVDPPGIPLYPELGSILATTPVAQDLLTDSGKPSVATIAATVTIDEAAWFGDITRVWGDWELSIGGRYYCTTSGGVAKQKGVALFAVNGSPTYDIEGEIKEEGFNPKVSLLWNATDNILTYAAASRGFRVGGVQPGFTAPGDPPAPETFKSDTLWNYELGIRTEWLDRTLKADLTVYHADWDNPQVFQLSSSGVGSYVDNAGAVESEGVEFALQYLFPIQGLSLTSAVSQSETVTTTNFIGSDGANVAAGAQWPFAPKHQSATNLAWAINVGDWLITPAITYTAISEAFSDLTKANAQQVFGYEQWDAQLGISNFTLSWIPEISIILNNAKDKRGITNHWASGTVDTDDVTYIRPRALTVRISGSF